jgi:hypothetical protein
LVGLHCVLFSHSGIGSVKSISVDPNAPVKPMSGRDNTEDNGIITTHVFYFIFLRMPCSLPMTVIDERPYTGFGEKSPDALDFFGPEPEHTPIPDDGLTDAERVRHIASLPTYQSLICCYGALF